MKRIYKNIQILKHQYAFSEFGQVVGIDKAEKIVNGAEIKYYLFNDLTFELILKDGQIKQKHFAIKSQYFEHNGKKYSIDHESESPEHYDAKLKIIKDGFFRWSDYLIKIKNPRLERRFSISYFRADLMAEMHSGETIFIEIVKSSNISKSKEKFIVENQLPTFKIYIDEHGNFIDRKFDFIGNREIEHLRKKYQEYSIGYSDQLEKRRKSWKSFKQEKERIDSEIRDLEERLRSKIEFEEHRLQYFYKDSGNDLSEIRSGIQKLKNEIRESIKISKSIKNSIKSNKKLNHESERLKAEINRMESLFIQASAFVKWEWVQDRNTKEPQGKDRLQQLKYFMT
jgi:hypothetical protein